MTTSCSNSSRSDAEDFPVRIGGVLVGGMAMLFDVRLDWLSNLNLGSDLVVDVDVDFRRSDGYH